MSNAFDENHTGFLDSKQYRIDLIKKCQDRLGVIVRSFEDGGGETINKNSGLLSLLDSYYKADVPSTNYGMHLKSIAFESGRYLISSDNLLSDMYFTDTRGEYLQQNVESILFSTLTPRTDESDTYLKNFLLSIIKAYFGGSTSDNMIASVLNYTGIPIEITEDFQVDRDLGLAYDPTRQFTASFDVNTDDPRVVQIGPDKFKQDVLFILNIIKPAHVFFQAKLTFNSFDDTIRKGYIETGELSPDLFPITIKKYPTSIMDTFRYDMFLYDYEHLNQLMDRQELNTINYIKYRYRYKAFDSSYSSVLHSENFVFNDLGLRGRTNDYNVFKSLNYDVDGLPEGILPNTTYYLKILDYNKIQLLDKPSGQIVPFLSQGYGTSLINSKKLVSNDVIYKQNTLKILNHGYNKFDKVRFYSLLILPVGIYTDTDYYVLPISSDQIKLLNSQDEEDIVVISDDGEGSFYICDSYFKPINVNTSENTININNNGFSLYKTVKLLAVDQDGYLPSDLSKSVTYYVYPKDINNFWLLSAPLGNVIDIKSKGKNIKYKDILFTPASVYIIENKIQILDNGIRNNQEIEFFTTGILPDPLQTNTIYYSLQIDADNFKVRSQKDGLEIDLLDIGEGSHSVRYIMPKDSDFFVLIKSKDNPSMVVEFLPDQVDPDTDILEIDGFYTPNEPVEFTSGYYYVELFEDTPIYPKVQESELQSRRLPNQYFIMNHASYAMNSKDDFLLGRIHYKRPNKEIFHSIKTDSVNNGGVHSLPIKTIHEHEAYLLLNNSFIDFTDQGSGNITISTGEVTDTFDASNIDIDTDIITIPGHNLDSYQRVKFDGTLPSVLNKDNYYFTYKIDINSIKILKEVRL